jgi:excisionase family DNA binding protein
MENENITHDVLTLCEAAEFLRVHENTLLRLATAKKVPGRKVGGRWRFSREALQRFLDPSKAGKAAYK